MRIGDLMTDYTDYLRHEKQLKHASIINYLTDLRLYADFERKHVQDITLDDLRAYQRHLSKAHGLKAATIRRKAYGLTTFWEWLKMQGYAGDILPRLLILPKKKQAIPKFLDEQQLIRFANTLDSHPNPRLAQRNQLAWKTLAWLGLRRSELLNLKKSDVLLGSQLVIIRDTKSGQDRTLPLLGDLYPTFSQWLEGWVTDEYIFHTIPATRWSKDALMNAFSQQLVTTHLDKVGITPHGIRHSCATMLHNRGVDLPTIQKILGHKDISSTMIYIHTAPNQVKQALQKHVLNNP